MKWLWSGTHEVNNRHWTYGLLFFGTLSTTTTTSCSSSKYDKKCCWRFSFFEMPTVDLQKLFGRSHANTGNFAKHRNIYRRTDPIKKVAVTNIKMIVSGFWQAPESQLSTRVSSEWRTAGALVWVTLLAWRECLFSPLPVTAFRDRTNKSP